MVPSNADLFMATNQEKEGDKRIYNPAEVCPRYSPMKIEVYKSFQWFKVQVLSKMENGKSRRVQIDAILFPSLFWPDLKRHQ